MIFQCEGSDRETCCFQFSGAYQDLNGGAKGDRTPDLGIANAALSQLSYRPFLKVGGVLGPP